MYCYNRHTLTQEEHDEISANKLNRLIIKIKKLFSKKCHIGSRTKKERK